ncbi:hypothetical protein DEO72_LG8g202 [Vigna unguiculata]|uniref:Uncharacterized protein n=2 Tax=Vigna unguiculata TaxID=3917 RepID=A0A4D6MNC6_VIGUN|nr:hypothetical protein DEO72_LG8g202 [Vigna unguiculata]
MDKEHTSVRVLLLVLLLMVWFCVCSGNADDEEQKRKPSFWEWQKLRIAYSAYSGLFFPNGWYNTLKQLLNHAYLRLFPPNIDFRREDKGAAEVNVKNSFSQSDADTKIHKEL